MRVTVADIEKLPWPPKCADSKCHKCAAQIDVTLETNYIVYDAEGNRFVRLCAKCGRPSGQVA